MKETKAKQIQKESIIDRVVEKLESIIELIKEIK